MYPLTGVSLNSTSGSECLILGKAQNASPHLHLHFRVCTIIGQTNTMSKHTPCLWESSDPDSDLNFAGWTKPYGNYHLNTWLTSIGYANLSGEKKKKIFLVLLHGRQCSWKLSHYTLSLSWQNSYEFWCQCRETHTRYSRNKHQPWRLEELSLAGREHSSDVNLFQYLWKAVVLTHS